MRQKKMYQACKMQRSKSIFSFRLGARKIGNFHIVNNGERKNKSACSQ